MISIKIKRIENHWYPCVNHELGYVNGFNDKISRYLNQFDKYNIGELTLEFEEIGVIWDNENIIIFNEKDIERYMVTDEDFELNFSISNHEFQIHSDLVTLLEMKFDFKFHKTTYLIDIY